MITAELLRSVGHTVDTADDGKAGLTLYRAKLHDLVITDIMMPNMDGLEVIGNLRQTGHGPHIIAMSGGSKLGLPLYLPVAKRLGVERILAKPILPDTLLQTVADVLVMPVPVTGTRARP